MTPDQLRRLRKVITENLRIQRGGAESVRYIDIGNVLADVGARQNHAIFGRRGCGKTLLLHHSAAQLPRDIQPIYLNCEDFKNHSFPDVLIEILDALFGEMQQHLTGWFGKKRRSRQLLSDIRNRLSRLKSQEDRQSRDIRESTTTATSAGLQAGGSGSRAGLNAAINGDLFKYAEQQVETRYTLSEDKIRQLNAELPRCKQQVRDFLSSSSTVKAVFLHIDDFYHLAPGDQPLVIDYIHRLCKDVPLFFKVATLRHATTLYIDRSGQPIGAQERHDYQSVNIDFTLADFRRTVEQNRRIFIEFAALAGIPAAELEAAFKGAGFGRLVLAGGGVPRDCLSLFLDVIDSVQPPAGDGRIGKDDVRILSRENFEHRIAELKQDSEGNEQGALLKAVYVIRQFCIVDRKTNVMLVSEELLHQDNRIRALLYRLLDYRIIHTAGLALTHKSEVGTFRAFAIDIGCYAHMRVLQGRFNELDLSASDAKERMRSAPILDAETFRQIWGVAPEDAEAALATQDVT
jgi:hypothetical protein